MYHRTVQAKVTRRGRTLTVKGMAAKTATVTVGGARKRFTIVRGRGSGEAAGQAGGDRRRPLRRRRDPARGDPQALDPHQSRGDRGASGTGPRVRGAAHWTAFASTRWM